MGLIRQLSLVLLCCVLYGSNPDEATFRAFLVEHLKKRGNSWLHRNLLAAATQLATQRQNFVLFSLVVDSEDQTVYLGALYRWMAVPFRPVLNFLNSIERKP